MRRDTPLAGGVTRGGAVASVAAARGGSAVVGRRSAPDRSHPPVCRWYPQQPLIVLADVRRILQPGDTGVVSSPQILLSDQGGRDLARAGNR